jgi:mono/diheme cytochrome c family protein
MTRAIFVAAILISGAVAGGHAQTPAATTPAGDAINGQRLYAKYTCHFCHGTAGQGGVAGARVALVTRNQQSFVRYVRRPSGQMPAFTEKVVPDRDLNDIFAYLRGLPAAKPLKDIPLLDALKDKPF